MPLSLLRLPERPEPVADELAETVESESVKLRVHRPEPELEIPADLAVPEFDEELLAKMFVNLAEHGMTLADLAG